MADFSIFHELPVMLGQRYLRSVRLGRHEIMPFPPVNICQEKGRIYVQVLLPGVEERDVTVEARGDELLLAGEIPPMAGQYIRQERYVGAFRRVIPLPETVLAESLKVTLAGGVLEVALSAASGQGKLRDPE